MTGTISRRVLTQKTPAGRDEPAPVKAYSLDGGVFRALAPGKYLIRATAGPATADCRVRASLKIP